MSDMPLSSHAPAAVHWETHLQQLHRQFYEQAGDRCLLWVNPAQGDPFADSEFVDACRIRIPISHPRFDPAMAPYLVPLTLSRSADADVFKTSVQAAWQAWELASLQAFQGQPIAGWVVGEMAPQALAGHWATQCFLHVDRGLHKLLRFHDPGVREWLWPSLEPWQQAALLGPTKAIVAFDRRQRLMRQEIGQLRDTGSGTGTGPARLALSRAQWLQVDDYAVLHAAWLHLCTADGGFAQGASGDQAWVRSTLAALEHATGHGIHAPEDRQQFAVHALRLGPDFHRHPRFGPVWEKVRAGDFYGGAVAEVFGIAPDDLRPDAFSD